MNGTANTSEQAMIHHAHSAYDATRTYRKRTARRRDVDVAYAGTAEAIAHLASAYPDWRAFGSPTQGDGLFLLVAPGCRVDDVPLDAGAEGWLELDPTEIAALAL
jgi:hypothetical protein